MAYVELTIQVPLLDPAKATGIQWTVFGLQALLHDEEPGASAHSGGDPANAGDYTDNLGSEATDPLNVTRFAVRMDAVGYSDRDGEERQGTFTWRNCWFALDIQTEPTADLEDLRKVWIAARKEEGGNYILIHDVDQDSGVIY
jgi:hypothetical protein